GIEVTSNNAALGLPSGEEESVCTGECHEDKDVVTRLLRDMQICDARAVFDSYFLSRWFKKSSSRGESRFGLSARALHQTKKILSPEKPRSCTAHGRLNFFSFSSMNLPIST
ncbi:hypothetical protein HID58_048263, partial [Brassica napus]